jgi:(S)-2-hydroxyglutarate dehydrogenase
VSDGVTSSAGGATLAATGATAPARCDVAVVGGGILGLAVARELTRSRPSASVCVLEREARLAGHQTSHNSGVIHAGIYYLPGSLKARLCVQGAGELYEYCAERGIEHERCGKVIVAVEPAELAGLQELERRGRANGVPGLRRIDARGIQELEPHCRGIAGLHSPNTGIVDFASVAAALADDVMKSGGTIATGCDVRGVRAQPRSVRLEHVDGATEAPYAIFCAGAWADRLAVLAGADPDPRVVPFRGAYLQLRASRRELVRGLIYPVPDPALPFLGVHLTRHVDGEVSLGPSALPVGARDAYSLRTLRGSDLRETLAWPGFWRMARRWWRTGLTEVAHGLVPSSLVRSAARYVPELRPRDAVPAFAGVRAQAVDRSGRLIDDFVISVTGRVLHVRNAPSPGASASLAIARHVVGQASQAFGW